ncbi:MAG: hypothetical protein ACRD0Q_04150 [Acidimicrobiales bacterium]
MTGDPAGGGGGDARITRATIEAKLAELRGDVETTTEAAKPKLLVAGMALAVVVVGAAFLLGRRRGRERSTVVEIRRV